MEQCLRIEKEEILLEDLKRAEEVKQQQIQEIRKKHLLEIIRLQDAAENLERLEKIKEMKREKFAEKLNTDFDRIEKIQQAKQQNMKFRKKLQSMVEFEKHSMISEFERKRRKLFLGSFDEKDIESILKPPTLSQSTKHKNNKSMFQQQTPQGKVSPALLGIQNRMKRSNVSMALLSPLNRSPKPKETPKPNLMMKRQSLDVKIVSFESEWIIFKNIRALWKENY